MSSYDLDSLEPVPGDYVMALNAMRAWEQDLYRGFMGEMIMAGEQALVLETWSMGNQRRIRVVRDHRILMFSCAEHAVRRNWRVVVPAPRLPTSGCP